MLSGFGSTATAVSTVGSAGSTVTCSADGITSTFGLFVVSRIAVSPLSFVSPVCTSPDRTSAAQLSGP